MAKDGVRIYRVRVFADGMLTRKSYVYDAMDGFHAINRLACFLMEGREEMCRWDIGGDEDTEIYHFALCVLEPGAKHEHTLYSTSFFMKYRPNVPVAGDGDRSKEARK